MRSNRLLVGLVAIAGLCLTPRLVMAAVGDSTYTVPPPNGTATALKPLTINLPNPAGGTVKVNVAVAQRNPAVEHYAEASACARRPPSWLRSMPTLVQSLRALPHRPRCQRRNRFQS